MTAKKYPCPVCRAEGRTPHLKSCALANKKKQFTSSKKKATKKSIVYRATAPSIKRRTTRTRITKPITRRLCNRIALVVDASGSMGGHKANAIEAMNAQLNSIKQNAALSKQETYVSIYTFNNSTSCIQRHVHPEAVQYFADYNYKCEGMTAMLDAIHIASQDLLSDHQYDKERNEKNTSYIVIVVTDGQENASHKINALTFKNGLQALQATDLWSFVISAPSGSTNTLVNWGFNSGNIQEWETTATGFTQMATNNSAGIGNYYKSRSLGRSSVQTFYTDLQSVSKKDLKSLTNVSDKFEEWKVTSSSNIADFVNDKLSRSKKIQAKVGTLYQPGRGYYELTKTENIQGHKDMVIMDQQGNMYGGDEARSLIGISATSVVKVTPGDHAGYKIFVKSTSMNRKLVSGTTLLYKTS